MFLVVVFQALPLLYNLSGTILLQKNEFTLVRFADLKPSAPQNLRAHPVGEEYLRLDWDNPQYHPGGVLHYIVYYKPQEVARYKKEITRNHENTYRLSDLQPNTQYEIYVTAKSSSYESDPSNIVLAKSGGKQLSAVLL